MADILFSNLRLLAIKLGYDLDMFSFHKCPICRGKTSGFFKHRDLFSGTIKIYKCRDCGHGSYQKKFSSQQFNSIYQVEYAQDYLDMSEPHELRKVQYKLDLELLGKLIDGDLNVLDIGCSSGGFLDAMPGNWTKNGQEVNPELIKHLTLARPEYKVFRELSEIRGEFDLITMRGVIEHIEEHSALISFLSGHLKPSGHLYICATPDFTSPAAIIYKQHWGQIVTPEHIHQFTPASLQILLSQAKLVLKELHHPYLGTPYENWGKDKRFFLENLEIEKSALISSVNQFTHAFPGNMMSVIFEKVT